MILDQGIMREIGRYALSSIKRRIRENKVSPRTDKKGTTLVSSARLLNSINYRLDGGSIIIGTNLEYARILHEGGVIRPRNAKALAIPLQPMAKVQSPRDFEDTFIRSGIIYLKQEGGKVLPLYKLQSSVRIPSRPYMFLDKVERDHISELVLEGVRRFSSGT